MNIQPIRRTGLALALLGSVMSTGAHAGNWDFNDLQVGWGSGNAQINNSGQIVGDTDYPWVHDTFYYSNGVFSKIGHLPGGGFEQYSTGMKINDAGVAYGVSTYTDFDYVETGAKYQNGQLTALDSSMTHVTSVNNHGDVLGRAGNVNYLLSNGTETVLPSAGSHTGYASINDSGRILGFGGNGPAWSEYSSMFTYENGAFTTLSGPYAGMTYRGGQMTNSGTLLFNGSWTDGGNVQHNANFLYQNGVYTDLSAAAAQAGLARFVITGINDLGQVVGNNDWDSGVPYGGDDTGSLAYLYSNGHFTNLSNYGIKHVTDINDHGLVVGYSVATNNLATLAVPVPEPSSYAMLAVGLAGLLLLRRRA